MQDSVEPSASRDEVALTPIVLPASGARAVPDDAVAMDARSGAGSGGSGGSGDAPSEASTVAGARVDAILDRIMSAHRPAVLAHLRGIRARHPQASPEAVQRILERRYLTTVTASGAGVGVAAAVPAVGTGAALALSGAETVLFLESTALFAQSVAELHGIAVEDPDRGRALVLAMVVGGPAQELITQFTGQATGKGPAKQEFWGAMIAKNLPRTAVIQFMDRVRKVYLPRMLASAGGGIVGRVLPFGVGAVVGGTANQLLGRRVVKTARTAFGPAPLVFPASTVPKVETGGTSLGRKSERAVAAAKRRAARDVARGTVRDATHDTARGTKKALPAPQKPAE